MQPLHIPISPGELLDRITILQIKSERISDEAKLANVRHELDLLERAWRDTVTGDATVRRIHGELKAINEELWVIEDGIRAKERAEEFDTRFIELARAVYHTNDRRAAVKKELNVYLGSTIIEEKSYQDYT